MNQPIAYIDEQPYEIKESETLLQFLRRHKGEKYIPTLCDAPNLKPFGSCRICCVETSSQSEGERRVVASCHTQVTPETFIYPHSSRIQKFRKNVLELILTDHKLDCEPCGASGNCELQEVSENLSHKESRYPLGANHLKAPSVDSHPYLRFNPSQCINCYRCIRVCDEVQGEFALSMYGRGFDSRVIVGADEGFLDSNCVSCGACSQSCPTQAITDIFHESHEAIDRRVRTICTYCGVGCNLDVSAQGQKILNVEAPWDAEVNEGHTCVKGRYAFRFYNHKDRVRSPMIRKNGVLEEVSWKEAYSYIVEKLSAIKSQYGPDAIGGISSARCTNEENYLMQKFLRAVIGTNNIDGCARVCHAPTALGMQRVFGTGAATNSIKDIEQTECILVIGANPTSAHPVTGAKIKQAAIKGLPLIVIDPYKTELAELANCHLQLRPGTNIAVLNMIFYFILTENLVDHKFVENRCEGFEEFKESVLNIDLKYLENISGVSQELAKKAAQIYAQAPSAMSFHGLGVTEHNQGTFAVMLIAQLALITGNIGKPGTGVNPLRGQNNVQGAADMGVQPHQGAGYLDVTDLQVKEMYEKHYGRSLPGAVGLKIPEMLSAAEAGDLKALWVVGEDISQTDPNTHKVNKSLKNLELLVVQELFITETARLATVVLPGASFLEKSGTFTNGERRVQRVNQVVDPLPGTKPDGQIIMEVMREFGYPQESWHPKEVLEEISQVVPFFKGISWDSLGVNGKQWPVNTEGEGTQILHTETFKRGKGLFQYIEFKETPEILRHSKEYPYILTTVRDLMHYNCGAMTRRTLNKEIVAHDFLLIHPDDARVQDLKEGESVKVVSERGEVTMQIKVSDKVKPRILRTTFHFPETMVNQLTSNVMDTESLCPEYKVTAVRLEALT